MISEVVFSNIIEYIERILNRKMFKTIKIISTLKFPSLIVSFSVELRKRKRKRFISVAFAFVLVRVRLPTFLLIFNGHPE